MTIDFKNRYMYLGTNFILYVNFDDYNRLEQSNWIECNKNHLNITQRRQLMYIGIVTHDAAPIYVTREKAVASNRLLFSYDKTKLIVLYHVYESQYR